MLKKIQEGVWQLAFKQFGSIVYLIKDNDKNILIDSSSMKNRTELLKDLSSLKIKPENVNIILLTHLHFDHAGNISLFKKAMIYASSLEIQDFKNSMEKTTLDKQAIKELNNINLLPLEQIQDTNFKIILCPGHTKGSVAFFYKDILFSGDTIFDDKGLAIGRTDFATSQPGKMHESVEKLLKLNFKILCPGH